MHYIDPDDHRHETPANPAARTAPRESPPASPCVMVIFGASGDLTKRKLLPALYNLRKGKLLGEHFGVIGVSRSPMSDDEFRARGSEDLQEADGGKPDGAIVDWLVKRLHYVPLDAENPASYQDLAAKITEVDREYDAAGNVVFYLATAPQLFGPTVRQLGHAGLSVEQDGHWRRVVIEKPFGHDLDSARALNHEILQVLRKTQVYRIDHYLGKETVQNILAFRFGNGIF